MNPKKKIIAMLLAGGQGSRLGILTKHVAKPAIAFGGKYKIIDFTLSNCINSGIDTVGVLTQYQPLKLNTHIGIGIPWDLDKNNGGVTILPPFIKSESGEWYSGTANAIYQNMPYVDFYDPDYVLILSGDHIYKMDYEHMLNYHIAKGADATIAVFTVPYEEASRFGIMNTDADQRIMEFEEKPVEPKNNLASMGIYIMNWKALRKALGDVAKVEDKSDFGKHIIPYMLNHNQKLFAYTFKGFWKDVGTLDSYWESNMELIKLVPDFNLYEAFWKIYTRNEVQPPLFISGEAKVESSIIGENCEIYGTVTNSVIGDNVYIGKNTVVKDAIIMNDTVIEDDCDVDKCIIAESCKIGSFVKMGLFDPIINKEFPKIYFAGITVIGEKTTIPAHVMIGKNCSLYGTLDYSDFENNILDSGQNILKMEDDEQ